VSLRSPKVIYGFLVHLPFYILNLPTILPLFLAGHFLYCAKLIPLSNVSNMWLRLYTGTIPCVTFSQCVVGESSFAGRRDHDSKSSIIVHLLQESIFEEIVAESLPQLIIQAINQTMNREWTTLGYISIIMSVSSFILTHHSRIPRVANICVHVPHLTRCAGRRSWP